MQDFFQCSELLQLCPRKSPDRGSRVEGTSRAPSEGYDLSCSWWVTCIMLDSRPGQIWQVLLLMYSFGLWFASLVPTVVQPRFQSTFLSYMLNNICTFHQEESVSEALPVVLLANSSGNLSSHCITRDHRGYIFWAKVKHLENSDLESFIYFNLFLLKWFKLVWISRPHNVERTFK